MNAQRFISILLLLPFSTFSADQIPQDSILLEAQRFCEEEDTSCYEPAYAKYDELAMEIAPPRVQKLPRKLSNPILFKRMANPCISLVGKPGVYKSAMAKAVARKAGWQPRVIGSDDLHARHRNESVERFKKEIMAIEQSGQKSVIILDELDAMTENYASESTDAHALSHAIWRYVSYLQEERPENICMIATMNDFNLLPEPLKTRLHSGCIVIEDVQTPERMKKCFLLGLVRLDIEIPKEVEPYLHKKIEELALGNPRMADTCSRFCEQILTKV